jgi:hypothetical protein
LAARGNLPLTFQMDAHGNGIWIMAMEDVDYLLFHTSYPSFHFATRGQREEWVD